MTHSLFRNSLLHSQGIRCLPITDAQKISEIFENGSIVSEQSKVMVLEVRPLDNGTAEQILPWQIIFNFFFGCHGLRNFYNVSRPLKNLVKSWVEEFWSACRSQRNIERILWSHQSSIWKVSFCGFTSCLKITRAERRRLQFNWAWLLFWMHDFTLSVMVLLLQTVSSLLPQNDKYLGLNIHGIKNWKGES